MERLLLHTSPELLNTALLVGRLFIGICFMIHGLGKLGIVGSGNMNGFVQWLKALKVPYPEMQARMAMASELGGGFLLTIGLLTRPACLVLMGTMFVASLIGHRGGGYLITNNPPGNEYTINLAAIVFVFLLIGPGQFSLDAIFFS